MLFIFAIKLLSTVLYSYLQNTDNFGVGILVVDSSEFYSIYFSLCVPTSGSKSDELYGSYSFPTQLLHRICYLSVLY